MKIKIHYYVLPKYQLEDEQLSSWNALQLVQARAALAAMNRPQDFVCLDDHPMLDFWLAQGWLEKHQIITTSDFVQKISEPEAHQKYEICLYHHGENYVDEIDVLKGCDFVHRMPKMGKEILYQPIGKGNDHFWINGNPKVPRPDGYSCRFRRHIPRAIYLLGLRPYVIGPHDGADGLGIAKMKMPFPTRFRQIACHTRNVNVMERLEIPHDEYGELTYSVQYKDGKVMGCTRQWTIGKEWYGNGPVPPEIRPQLVEITESFIEALPIENRYIGGIDIPSTSKKDGRCVQE